MSDGRVPVRLICEPRFWLPEREYAPLTGYTTGYLFGHPEHPCRATEKGRRKVREAQRTPMSTIAAHNSDAELKRELERHLIDPSAFGTGNAKTLPDGTGGEIAAFFHLLPYLYIGDV